MSKVIEPLKSFLRNGHPIEIKYLLKTDIHYPEMINYIRKYYYTTDPLLKSINFANSPKSMHLWEVELREMIRKETSVVVVSAETGKLIGFSICDHKTRQSPSSIAISNPEISPEFRIVTEIEEKFQGKILRENQNINSLITFEASVALPTYTQQGMFTQMLNYQKENVLRGKADMIFVLCTSVFSARGCDQAGFKTLWRQDHRDILHDNQPLFRIEPPHDEFSIKIFVPCDKQIKQALVFITSRGEEVENLEVEGKEFKEQPPQPSAASLAAAAGSSSTEDPPEGYYAFVESPNAEPPRVRPPPYTFTAVECREDDGGGGNHHRTSPHVSPYNLCGDLNKGTIPRNPMKQNVLGSAYPFELIRNMTLKYLSRTLPILKADETLPKVAQLQDDLISQNTISPYQHNDRVKRETPRKEEESGTNPIDDRKGKKFCDQGGVFCMLYKAINGENPLPSGTPNNVHLPIERRDEIPPQNPLPRYEGPPTPCPAKVEYATPVFAKNYQGIWRYVVQIPYEGYFTQTVEVTRCLQSRCHYLDGGCLSSPRWSSLLVAEIYYPDTVLSNPETGNAAGNMPNAPRSPVAASQPPSVQDFQNYQQYLHKRAGLQATPLDTLTTTPKPTHCDGMDNLGCFQVRLYYDWFLIPGSCKCWRPDYFNKYVRRKNPEL